MRGRRPHQLLLWIREKGNSFIISQNSGLGLYVFHRNSLLVQLYHSVVFKPLRVGSSVMADRIVFVSIQNWLLFWERRSVVEAEHLPYRIFGGDSFVDSMAAPVAMLGILRGLLGQ